MELTDPAVREGFDSKPLGDPLHLELQCFGAGLHAGDVLIPPGGWMFAAMSTGGRILVMGPGEQLEIHVTRPAWTRVHLPEASAVRAAAWGCDLGMRLRVEGAVNEVWLWQRPVRQSPLVSL